MLKVKIKSLPCFEHEGMIWVWPGSDPPTSTLPSLLPPPGFQIHAEVNRTISLYFFKLFVIAGFVLPTREQIVIELPVEHGLLLDNLLDLAHAPFTHTSTFAKGWAVPRYSIHENPPCLCLLSNHKEHGFI